MLTTSPLKGRFPLLQSFGDHPKTCANPPCDNAGLHGHTGIDYATPVGTPVFAVEDGTVLEVVDGENGFDIYVVLGHTWGQTVYAHLEQATVVQGWTVGSGKQVGFSGSSGACAQPHLHFGMRIHPFSVDDGWCGYSDPQPYLDRLTQPRGAIIGPHLVGAISPQLDLLAEWQPRLALVLDPSPDEIHAMRQVCADTVIVGRPFAPDHEVEARIRADPVKAARWAHDLVMARVTPAVDYWQVANEVLQKPDDLPLLNAFEQARMDLADEHGYKCALFAFSVGNPDLPEASEATRMNDWQLVYPAIEQAERNRHIIAVHQYGMPDLWGPSGFADWLIYRLEHQVLRRLPFKKVQFAVTEYGIDGLIREPRVAGWQRFTDADDYAQQLLRIGRYTERFSGRVLGYAVFTLGHNAPWGTYDIAGQVATTLATASRKGVWADVDVQPDGYTPHEGHTDSPPPVEPLEPAQPEQPLIETEQPTEPTTPDKGDRPMQPILRRRMSDAITAYNMRLTPLEDRPDQPEGDEVFVIKDVFTSVNGSWEPSGEPGSVPDWARADYWKPEFLAAGADHHLFAAVVDQEGNFITNQPIVYWSDGLDRLGDPNYDGYTTVLTKESSGWANHFMAGGSSFAPDRGESGPWCWAPEGAAEVMCGGGLPASHLVSTFVVWQKMTRAEYETAIDTTDGGQPHGPTGPEQPSEPLAPTEPTVPSQPAEPDDPAEPAIPVLEHRISDWADRFHLTVKSFRTRPDGSRPHNATAQSDEIVFILKDLFTSAQGSWEPSDHYGAIPAWARDAYLKPWGAPDYFDDAGGDHHLFAAVIGLDGELIRDQEIRFWSDGYDKLDDPAYDGYVLRRTKEKSGWINIPIGPGSAYIPERDKGGPWCWAPTGTADVVCGGGLPAKQHISTFAVWQAMRRSRYEARSRIGLPQDSYGSEVAFDAAADAAVDEPMPSSTLRPMAAAADAAIDEVSRPRNFTAAAANFAQQDSQWLRQAAWQRIGFESGHASVLATHARAHRLGMPVTQGFHVGDYVVQGYMGGIVYMRPDEPSSLAVIPW